MIQRYSKEIYSRQSIKATISDYSDLCHIVLTEDDKYWYCDFDRSKVDINLTMAEFENYLICITGMNNVLD